MIYFCGRMLYSLLIISERSKKEGGNSLGETNEEKEELFFDLKENYFQQGVISLTNTWSYMVFTLCVPSYDGT